LESDKDIHSLRDTNNKLNESEKELAKRLTSAEEDLETVRATNKRLESFLERVERDMAHAETAFEESEKRLEQFVEESGAKLDAARDGKLKYKQRLSERNNEIDNLLNQNSDLLQRIGEKTEEVSALKKGQEEMKEQLEEKDKFVTDLRTSSDKRQRSMNLAYNELRSKYEKHVSGKPGASATRPQRNRAMTDYQLNKVELNSSHAALEQEVQGLREDKKAFEQLVTTLQEKVRQLQILEEWHEAEETPSKAGPSRAGPDSMPSTPTTQHTRSSRPGSALSRPTSVSHPSMLHDRPTTGMSTYSKPEDLQAWATEIERVRMLRNEQAVQLKDNKKARHDLRRSLKESKTQLHQLEKQKGTPDKLYALLSRWTRLHKEPY
jgi:chromosome segregation ATPase